MNIVPLKVHSVSLQCKGKNTDSFNLQTCCVHQYSQFYKTTLKMSDKILSLTGWSSVQSFKIQNTKIQKIPKFE